MLLFVLFFCFLWWGGGGGCILVGGPPGQGTLKGPKRMGYFGFHFGREPSGPSLRPDIVDPVHPLAKPMHPPP